MTPPAPSTLDHKRALTFPERAFADSIVSTLVEYVSIPNKSPAFDPEWEAHGHMDRAVALVEAWCKANALPDMKIEVIRLEVEEHGDVRTELVDVLELKARDLADNDLARLDPAVEIA